MSQAPALEKPVVGNWVRLSDIDWQTYSRLLRAFAEQPGVRLTYDRGELEIMSPLLEHDDDTDFLGILVRTLTEECGLPVRGGGSVTLRRRRRQRGLEPDRCYWIANAALIAGKRKLDLRKDPPPDLALEVDVSHGSLDRMEIYAALAVPEVWRLAGDLLTFFSLGPDGHYVSVPASRSFPLVRPEDLMPFVRAARAADDQNAIVQRFREWVRQSRKNP